MKKFTFLAIFLIAMVSMALAQTNMFVWMDGIKTTYPIALVDSVTFGDDEAPIGGIGVFSVGEGKTVTFSPGNLQYTQSTNTWSFAENQYDYLGEANIAIDADVLADKVDLFGWSTGATNFGVSTSKDNNDYSGSFVDWGTNKIGTDAPNTWRTLTRNEWEYLLETRPNASSLCGVAQVNGVNGLIFLPDNWTCPAGVTFKSGFHSDWREEAYGQYQIFTAEQWSKLESAGAVFLPAAGRRYGSNVYNVPLFGYCWSATEYDSNSNFAYCLDFGSDEAGMGGYYRYCGQSVRLVKDISNTTPEPPIEPQDTTIYRRVDITICENDLPYIFTGRESVIELTEAGTYTYEEIVEEDNYIYHFIYTLELTVMASETQEYFFEVVVCENELPYVWNGGTITKAGLYLFEESLECGVATYILELEVLEVGIFDTIWVEAYDSYEWHGKVYTESGQYQYYNDCSSVEVLNLTIIKTPTKPEGDNCENAIQVNWNDEITICGSTDTWYAIDISGIWERGEDITTTFRNNSAETATITTESYPVCYEDIVDNEIPLTEAKSEVKSGEERTIVYDFDQLLDFFVYYDIIYLHIKNDGGCVTAPALWFWLPATEDVVE